MTPPKFPEIDESAFARVTVHFRSGTPAMTYWCSRASVFPDLIRLDIDVDATVKSLVEMPRHRVQQLVVDFDATPGA